MRLKFLALGLAMATTALLSACGGGSDDDSGNAQVRLLNVSPGYASLDLKETDAATLNGAVALGSTGAYASLDLDTKGLYLAAAGSTTSLATPSTAGLTKDYSYTVVGWGASGALGTLTLDEQETAPDSGKSKVLILNLAAGAGTVDVYLNKVGVASLDEATVKAASIGTGRGDSYRTIDASAYRLRVTAAGNSSDVRLDVPSITLDSTKVYGVILVSSGSGNMVNAYVLPYKSSPTLFSNPTSNVRVISALPRSTTLSASLNGTSMFSGTASPAVSGYQNLVVTNGATLDWSVNGVAQPAKTITLSASSTYGMLVWGDPAAPTVTSLEEFSVLPISAGTAKVRVLHAAQGLGAASLVVNLSPKLSGIAAGTLSSATVLTGTEEVTVEVRADGQTLYSETRSFTSGASYTVYLIGTPGHYEALLLRDL